jgi:uncharacterized protein YqjF (DUF2071 family)
MTPTADSSVASTAQTSGFRPALAYGRPVVMWQSWLDLLFLHWPIRSDELRVLIPPQLELDLFEGTAYVGLVAFTMTGVRPRGLPAVPGLSRFHETNLRTYVRVADRDAGVWFFSLDAGSAVAVRLARSLFHLPYHDAQFAPGVKVGVSASERVAS